MWVMPALPSDGGAWRRAVKKINKSVDGSVGSQQQTSSSSTHPSPSATSPYARGDHGVNALVELFEPAVEGPPSPESIRALSKQVKRASYVDKHLSQHTSSSGSSSLLSRGSGDRPSWEHNLEGLALSRKSSGHSTSSSMPSRERPESVQIFGKTLFNRRNTKMRRESSVQLSADAIAHAADFPIEAPLPAPPPPPSTRDTASPGLFSRRRTMTNREQPEEPAAAARKLNISGPYNFQHVTHTQRDDFSERPPMNRVASESAPRRSPMPPPVGGFKALRGESTHFGSFSSEALHARRGSEVTTRTEYDAEFRHQRRPSVPKPNSPPRRGLKHTRSQEQLMRVSPPQRPPRSPMDALSGATHPVPLPRLSSRASTSYGPDSRPQTGESVYSTEQEPVEAGLPSPPTTSHSYRFPEMDAIPEDRRFSRLVSPTDDANWPLPCASSYSAEHTLPELTEEEDENVQARQSHTSMASISSLRGSQSVPMLRAFSSRQEQHSRHRSSGASETLGNLLAAGKALKASMEENYDESEALPRASWEDDIDYCYDHAVEADCDYAWERPSLDLVREDENATPMFRMPMIESCEVSPAMLSPGQFDLPALSPASQVSMSVAQEAITPTALGLPRASNFSMPRPDTSLLHVRKPSNASSFKESHGFTLSPSLLIPQDFQQAMLEEESDSFEFEHCVDRLRSTQPRISASTTGSIETSETSGFERHISTASASTDFTRLTASTTSLDTESYMLPKSDSFESLPAFEQIETIQPMPTLPESDELMELPPLRRDFTTSGSDPNLVALASGLGSPTRTKEPIVTRRARARTASLSTPPPPGQYSLFPGVQMTGPRI